MHMHMQHPPIHMQPSHMQSSHMQPSQVLGQRLTCHMHMPCAHVPHVATRHVCMHMPHVHAPVQVIRPTYLPAGAVLPRCPALPLVDGAGTMR